MLPRERFAWVWTVALVVVLGAYFAGLAMAQEAWLGLPFLHKIGWLALALGTLGVVALAAWPWTRGEGTVDERDHAIERRASVAAYQVLMAGMIVVGCVLPFTQQGWAIVHAALLAIALAELVHSGLMLRGYRRGWHG